MWCQVPLCSGVWMQMSLLYDYHNNKCLRWLFHYSCGPQALVAVVELHMYPFVFSLMHLLGCLNAQAFHTHLIV